MAEPTKYAIEFDFTAAPYGPQMNVEFQNIETSISETIDALGDIRRSDGKLQNGIVDGDALSIDAIETLDPVVAAYVGTATDAAATATTKADEAAASAATASGAASTATTKAGEASASAAAALAAENSLLEWAGEWATATAYAPSDIVRQEGSAYVCLAAHTSGTFSTDQSAGKWDLFAAKGSVGPGGGDLLSTNNLSDLDSAATALANLGGSTSGVAVFTGTPAEGRMAMELGGLAMLNILDEDNFGSNSSTRPPSQQSTKAYIATLPFTKSYASAAQSVSSGSLITLSHGLGARPKVVSLLAQFTSATNGYSPGDIAMINSGYEFPSSSSASRGFAVVLTATEIKVRCSNSGGVGMVDFSDGGRGQVSLSDMKLIVEAWA